MASPIKGIGADENVTATNISCSENEKKILAMVHFRHAFSVRHEKKIND